MKSSSISTCAGSLISVPTFNIVCTILTAMACSRTIGALGQRQRLKAIRTVPVETMENVFWIRQDQMSIAGDYTLQVAGFRSDMTRGYVDKPRTVTGS